MILDYEQLFKSIQETNNKIIAKGEVVIPIVIYFKGTDKKAQAMPSTKIYPKKIQSLVKAHAIKNGVDAYTIIYPQKIYNKKIQKQLSGQLIYRAVYTPKHRIRESIYVRNNHIQSSQGSIDDRDYYSDSWDAWNKTHIEVKR